MANEKQRKSTSEAVRWAGWIVLLAIVGLYVQFQGRQALRAMHGNDFKHIYLGALVLDHGLNPYDGEQFLRWAKTSGFDTINPYVYPPTTGLALRFLTVWKPVEWRKAARFWFYLNHAMVAASLLLCAWFFLGFRNPWRLVPVALLAALFFPLWRTLTAGQLNCVLLLVYCGVYWGLSGRRDWFAGLMVAFGMLFKLVPGIFVVYFLWKRRWRALGWTAAWCALMLSVSVALMGWRVHAAYVPVMRAMGYGHSVWEERLIAGKTPPFYRDPLNQSFNSLFHHLLAPDPVGLTTPWVSLDEARGRRLANGLTVLASMSVLAVALWAMGWRKEDQGFGFQVSGKKPTAEESVADNHSAQVSGEASGQARQDVRAATGVDPSRLRLEVALTVILGLLLPSIMWDHYLMILFLPVIVLFGHLVDRGRLVSWEGIALCGAGVLMAVPVLFWPHKLSGVDFTRGPGLLLMSITLYGVLILLGLLVHSLRNTRSFDEQSGRGESAESQAPFSG